MGSSIEGDPGGSNAAVADPERSQVDLKSGVKIEKRRTCTRRPLLPDSGIRALDVKRIQLSQASLGQT